MKISELIVTLKHLQEAHGDVEVGYHSSPGAHSWSAVSEVEFFDSNSWSEDWPDRLSKPRLPENWVIDLYNGDPG